MLHDLGGSHVGCFDSCLFTFCQSHNALHAPGKILFKTLTFSWRELGQACPNIAQIPGTIDSFEAVGKPHVQSIHVEKFETGHHFKSLSPECYESIGKHNTNIHPGQAQGS